ncbi:hypothetical protein [Sphingomonas sp.]|uniref:hypothetical protein n=1 Tax=Sphingomonas sp. TaxID=28214 RepID=UPI0031D1CC60
MPGTRLGLEQLAEMLGRTTLTPAMRDGKTVDLTDILLEAALTSSASRASTLHNVPQSNATRRFTWKFFPARMYL